MATQPVAPQRMTSQESDRGSSKRMITTGETEARVEAHATADAPVAPAATRRGLAALWGARGWWGGLIACGLAALAQNALIGQNDPETAGRYYLLAIVLLIAVFFHPAWSWCRRAGASPAPTPEKAAMNGAAPEARAGTAPAANGAGT